MREMATASYDLPISIMKSSDTEIRFSKPEYEAL